MLKLSNFSVIRKLGRGAYGEVYLVRKQGSDQLLAVKCIPRKKLSKRGEDNLVSEISILQKLCHPHIVRMLDFSWDAQSVYLFMEYCAGGDLSDFLHSKHRLSEHLVRRFLRQMALALQYLKEKNIIHMDLKPQNILLTSSTNPVLKVTDFGFAKRTKDTIQLNELRGTLLYMAPEVYCEGIYHPSCDLWSVGVILYECLFGNPPYASEDSTQLRAKLLKGEPIVFPKDVRISANCAALLRGLLKRDPEERMNHDEFFEHPFVDVKHAPSADSLDKALTHLEKARELEKQKNLKAAYEYYTHGLSHLVAAVEYETSPHQRELLRQLATQYFTQAEGVKSRLKSEEARASNNIPPRPPPPWAQRKDHSTLVTETTIRSTQVPAVATSKPKPTVPAPPFKVAPPRPQGLSYLSKKSDSSPPSSPSSGLFNYFKGLFFTSIDHETQNQKEVIEESPSPEQQPTTPPRISEIQPQPLTVPWPSKVDPASQMVPPSAEIVQTQTPIRNNIQFTHSDERNEPRMNEQIAEKMTTRQHDAHPSISRSSFPPPPFTRTRENKNERQASSVGPSRPSAATSHMVVPSSASCTDPIPLNRHTETGTGSSVFPNQPANPCTSSLTSEHIIPGIASNGTTPQPICTPSKRVHRRSMFARAFHLLARDLRKARPLRRKSVGGSTDLDSGPSIDFPTPHTSTDAFCPSTNGLRNSTDEFKRSSEHVPATPDEQLERPESPHSELSSHTHSSQLSMKCKYNPEQVNPTHGMQVADFEEQPLNSPEDSTTRRMQRVRALSMDLSTPASTCKLDPETISPSTYAQQMALIADTARLFELKEMCATSDTDYSLLLGWLEEFYSLLRTNQLSVAMKLFKENFEDSLRIAKEDTNEARRSAFLKELKLVLDLMETGKQQNRKTKSDQHMLESPSVSPVPEEIGTEATLEAEPANDSCCIS